MALINTDNVNRSKAGVKALKKHVLKIDMTPMVDLGFLLISFFIFTTELTKPVVTNLVMPKDGKPMPLAKSNALSLLLINENTIYYYDGEWDNTRPVATSFDVHSGIGQVIRNKQLLLDQFPEGRDGLMLLIKPGPGASYKNVIDALDEALINDVKKYAIIKPEPPEQLFMEGKAIVK